MNKIKKIRLTDKYGQEPLEILANEIFIQIKSSKNSNKSVNTRSDVVKVNEMESYTGWCIKEGIT